MTAMTRYEMLRATKLDNFCAAPFKNSDKEVARYGTVLVNSNAKSPEAGLGKDGHIARQKTCFGVLAMAIRRWLKLEKSNSDNSKVCAFSEIFRSLCLSISPFGR